MLHRVVLLTVFEGDDLARLNAILAEVGCEVVVARALADLEKVEFDQRTTMLAFGTGVIVPAALLKSMSRPAYNLHAASPAFPGRDPHHFAVYAGATRYGATLHVMTASVDAGPIVATELFDVPEAIKPGELLRLANAAGVRLIEANARLICAEQPMPPLADMVWGQPKHTRADFLAACRIPADISEAEFARRFRAFDGEMYDNLTVEIQGWTFRIDKKKGRNC
ncbi:formyltransferase family protein [Bradyrhizobium sp. USDA 4451]